MTARRPDPADTGMPDPPGRLAWARAGGAYVTIVFAAGFVLGAIRVLVLVPRLGELFATLLELPVILTISWIVAGVLTRRFRLPVRGRERLAMGGLAFALLMGAELGLAAVLYGLSPVQWLARLATPAGATGLAAQIVFGLIPWLRSR